MLCILPAVPIIYTTWIIHAVCTMDDAWMHGRAAGNANRANVQTRTPGQDRMKPRVQLRVCVCVCLCGGSSGTRVFLLEDS